MSRLSNSAGGGRVSPLCPHCGNTVFNQLVCGACDEELPQVASSSTFNAPSTEMTTFPPEALLIAA